MDVNIMCFRRLLIVLIVTLESMCKSEDCYCLKKLVGDINSPVFVEQDSVNGKFYVAQQTGVVHIYSKDWKRESNPLVNLTNDVHISNSIWDERGLLSIALHPQFHSNKQIFTYSIRIINGKEYAVVSKLEIRPDLLKEDIILAVEQANQKLNGGQALFGNDGLLYVSIGDGGSLDNKNISFAQSSSSLLGKILRINVDETEVVDDHLLFYSIPKNNPFVENASWRSEIFALGARNMWRCSVDKGTGYLYCGDVGDTDTEEINLIKPGKNYGWNIFEGSIEKINRTKNETIDNEGPIYSYPHGDMGHAVVGGYVYRGKAFSSLFGQYIFGDYVSGKLFRLKLNESNSKYNLAQCAQNKCPCDARDTPGKFLQSFSTDSEGELFMLTKQKGEILKLIPPLSAVTTCGSCQLLPSVLVLLCTYMIVTMLSSS
ncbi:HHIP-like protein 1 [Mytilus trossulus]|uniref:HHIP-like protein 1 n=1 Tax=Mytilus trossulus TaxID=6551 RepID=UPI0030068E74